MHRMRLAVLGILPLLIASQGFACVGGQEWTKEMNGLTVDVTDDTPTIDPGQAVHFDFGLYTKSTDTYGEPVGKAFSTADVTLLHGTDVIKHWSIDQKPDRELTGFDYIFPNQNADDVMSVRYTKDGKELAADSFPLTVGGGGTQTSRNAVIAIGAGVAALLLGLMTMGRGKKHSPSR